MSRVSDGSGGLVSWLIAVAVSRWPGELRAEMSAAWTAEVAAVGREPGVGPVARSWRALRFALSLAVARPVEPLGEQPRGWRHHLVGTHRALGALLVLLVVPVVAVPAAQLTSVLPMLAMYFSSTRSSPLEQGLRSACAIGAVIVAALLGGRLAGRFPLVPVGDWRHRPLACVVAPTAVLLVGALAVSGWLFVGSDAVDGAAGWLFHAAGTAVALASAALVAVPVARCLVRGRRKRAVVFAVAGALVAAGLGVAVAGLPTVRHLGLPVASLPLWLPMDLFAASMEAAAAADEFGPTAFNPMLPLIALAALPKVLFFSAAFGIGYIARLRTLTGDVTAVLAAQGRPGLPPQAAPAPNHVLTLEPGAGPVRDTYSASASGVPIGAAAAAAPVPPVLRAVAAGAVAVAALVGIAVWAATAAGLLVHPPSGPSDPDYYVDYAADLRYAAIVLVGVAVAAAAAQLGAVLTPALLVVGGLIGTDLLLVATQRTGQRYAVTAAVLGAVVGCLALRLSPLLVGRARTAAQRRRVLAGVAVVAAFSAPAVPGHGEAGYVAPGVPTGIGLAGMAVSGLLVLLAGGCAIAARPRPPAGARLAALILVTGILAGAVGAASTHGLGYLFGPPLAVAALATARFPVHRPVRSTAYWLAMTGVAGLAAPALWFLTGSLGGTIGSPLLLLTAGPDVLRGTSVVLGAPLTGLAFAAVFNRQRGADPVAPPVSNQAAVRAR